MKLLAAEDASKLESPSFHEAIKIILNANEKYSDDVECMTAHLIDNDFIKGFITSGMSRDLQTLKRELEPHLPEAKKSCQPGWFQKLVTSCFGGSETDD